MPFDGTSCSNVEAIAIVDKMIELLATRRQWCKLRLHKKRFFGGEQAYCLLGAYGAAIGTGGSSASASNAVFLKMNELTNSPVISFNDSLWTRHRHIMTFLSRLRASFEQ